MVLESLVYERPPRPIIKYRDLFEKTGSHVVIRVLRPSVESILERRRLRGRTDDAFRDARRNIEHQLWCLHDATIEAEWVVDSSDETQKDTYQQHFAGLVDGR